MKRTHFAVACLLLAFTGCSCGQGWSCWRPANFFSRLHDRIHGTNVGAPCMSGACAAPVMAAPTVAVDGCETCGNGVQTMGYENYPSTYDGEVTGGSYGNTFNGSSVQGEVIPHVRAQ